MIDGNRIIILPEHISKAEHEPDPRASINEVQGPLNGWIMRRVSIYGDNVSPENKESELTRVKDEIVLAYNAIRYAHGGVLPRVEVATIDNYFQTLMPHPGDDVQETPADPAKIEVVKNEFKAQQVHLYRHIVQQLGATGVLYDCGMTCIVLGHEMLLIQEAELHPPK